MGARIKLAVGVAVAALAIGASVPAFAASNGGKAGPSRPATGMPGAPTTVVGSGGGVSGSTGGSVAISRPGVAMPAYPSRPVGIEPDASIPCPMRYPAECFPYPGPLSDHSVTVTGSALVSSRPDEAVVGLGVQTEATDAADALRENATRMDAVITALTDLGIDRSDIATAYVSLMPMYDSNGTHVTSYQAQNQITVTLHDLSKVGSTIDAATAAGANLTSGITFQLSHGSPALTSALREAVADARAQADVLAAAAGATLGDVIAISEGSVGSPIPYAEAGAARDATTPVIPPDVQTSVSVTVAWALQPAA